MGTLASKRVAALDLGEAYTGVALSDPGGTLASPLEVIPSDRLTGYLRGLLAGGNIREVVVGVPKTLDGTVGFQAKRALGTLGALEDEFPGVRFVPWDERLTTRVARAATTGNTRKRGRRRGARSRARVDHLAAATMLQEYLDRGGALHAAR